MKFYDCSTAPSPRRVRIFIAEKGIDIPTVQVNLAAGEQLTEAFRAKNPRCTVPVLELDDGTCLWETLAICDYLECQYLQPPLMGRDAKQRARVLQWNHRIEQEGFLAAAEMFRNSSPGLKGRALTGAENHEQIPALAERGGRRLEVFLREMDKHFATNAYVAGDLFTMADITALVTVDFARRLKFSVEELPHLKEWYARVSQRPSARA
jgi:glutathione S-transferase